MNSKLILIILLSCLGLALGSLEITNQWETGYQAVLTHHVQNETHGWNYVLEFDVALQTFETYAAVISGSVDSKLYTLVNQEWDPVLPGDQDFALEFVVGHLESPAPVPKLIRAAFNGQNVDL